MASIPERADKHLVRLDRKAGEAATYRIFTGTTTNNSGQSTPNFTNVNNVKVRPFRLRVIDRMNLASAGLVEVETAWKIRKAYVTEPKKDDEIHLTTSGFKYQVLDSDLDRVQADWILYVRRLKFQS
jgi:hypothetical protein